MIYDIDDRFPTYGSWNYKGETIREVLKVSRGQARCHTDSDNELILIKGSD